MSICMFPGEEEDDRKGNDGRIEMKLVRNGNPQKITSIKIKRNLLHDEFCEQIAKAMDFRSSKGLRIFKHGGVEVMEDETKYISDGVMLYISKGEDFDEASNFAIYGITRTIGQGGYGKVYEAFNQLTNERVAIKMLDRKKMKSQEELQMLFKEVQSLQALNHKNILKIINCFYLKSEDTFALVLEFLDGGDLRKYVNEQGPLDEQTSQNIFVQLHDAINYCHRQRVIHRDLKLENLMFEDSEQKVVKVVDFGIAGSDSKINTESTNAGSIRFLAPEVILSRHPAHPGIDIWAMGVILFWMLNGRPPFDGSTRQEIMEKILRSEYSYDKVIKKKLSKSIRNLIEMMLQVDMKERFDMKQIYDHPWMNNPVEKILQQEKQQEEMEKLEMQKQLELEKAEMNTRVNNMNKGGRKLMKQQTMAVGEKGSGNGRSSSIEFGKGTLNKQKTSLITQGNNNYQSMTISSQNRFKAEEKGIPLRKTPTDVQKPSQQ